MIPTSFQAEPILFVGFVVVVREQRAVPLNEFGRSFSLRFVDGQV